jgi:hypothetical protein
MMFEEQWKHVRYFNPGENWGDPDRMDPKLILELDRLRHFIGFPIVIHCGYEERGGRGFHPEGRAVDCHVETFDALDFFFAAIRFNFSGLGIYPWWDRPGLHLDTRPTVGRGYRFLWGSTGPKKYVDIDARFLCHAVGSYE